MGVLDANVVGIFAGKKLGMLTFCVEGGGSSGEGELISIGGGIL